MVKALIFITHHTEQCKVLVCETIFMIAMADFACLVHETIVVRAWSRFAVLTECIMYWLSELGGGWPY